MSGIFTYMYHKNQLNVGEIYNRPMDPMGMNKIMPNKILNFKDLLELMTYSGMDFLYHDHQMFKSWP